MNYRHNLQQGITDPWAASVYWKKNSDAPDYTPMQEASVYSAQVGAELGREQMAQAKDQYDQSMAVAKPVIEKQLAMMDSTQKQGDDYYNYMVEHQRPIEDALNKDAMANASAPQDAADRAKLMGLADANAAQDDTERALITGGDTGVYNARQADIEDSVGRAVADARNGQASTTNQMIRQALRYGYSPDKLAAMAGSQGLGMASQQASAANGTRQAGIQNARALMGQSYDMRNATNANRMNAVANDRGLRLSDDARTWGKRMDAAGLYRGLAGASQGAYGLSGQLGSSAVGNQMAPGNARASQMAQGAGTVMQGAGQQIQGLGSVLNSQTSSYNQQQSSSGDALGAVAGIAAKVAPLMMMSDRRLKENIERVGTYINGLPTYEFNYRDDPIRYRGVMAQDVETEFPEAIVRMPDGMMAVRYDMLGISMERI